MPDAHSGLLRALAARTGDGERPVLRETHAESWASATFTGARHSVTLAIPGPSARARANRLADGLDAIEFTLPGHLVADIAVTHRIDSAEDSILTIEALTVEDW